MRQWTTPTLPLVVEGVDLTGMRCWVSIRQGGRLLEVEAVPTYDAEADESSLSVTLTQEQTGAFTASPVTVQVNFIDALGHRDATDEKQLPMNENLLKRVVSYDGD